MRRAPARADEDGAAELRVSVPAGLVEEIAQRAAEIVLEQLDARGVAAAPVSPLMTVEEAAEFLRAKPQRVYDLLSDGRLTRRKDGSRVLVARAELEAHVAADRIAQALPTRNGSGSRRGLAS